MPVSVFFSYAGILIFDTFPVSAGEIQGSRKLNAGLLLELGDA